MEVHIGLGRIWLRLPVTVDLPVLTRDKVSYRAVDGPDESQDYTSSEIGGSELMGLFRGLAIYKSLYLQSSVKGLGRKPTGGLINGRVKSSSKHFKPSWIFKTLANICS